MNSKIFSISAAHVRIVAVAVALLACLLVMVKSPAVDAQGDADTATVTLTGDDGQDDTGLDVAAGDVIIITAEGEMASGAGSGPYSVPTGPDGLNLPAENEYGVPPLPSVAIVAVIGAIDGEFDSAEHLLDDGADINENGQTGDEVGYPGIFGAGHVGANFTGIAPQSGDLVLAINDAPLDDNVGAFTVQIQVIRQSSLTQKVMLPLVLR